MEEQKKIILISQDFGGKKPVLVDIFHLKKSLTAFIRGIFLYNRYFLRR